MELLDIKDYDIVNYKKPSMFLIFPNCSFKCGIDYCQNYQLSFEKHLNLTNDDIIKLYTDNPLTHAVVCGGLEPFDSFEDLLSFIKAFRKVSADDIVIYTGYYSFEILEKVKQLCGFENIIIKFGRYKPNQEPHYDATLGVKLASDRQFAVKLQNAPDIIDALLSTDGYCPCALTQEDDTLCCCKDFRCGNDKECHCGLYQKEIKE